MLKTISLLWASLRARPRLYLQVSDTTANLHTLELRTYCYASIKTDTTKADTLVALSSFLDRVIPVKERQPFLVIIQSPSLRRGSMDSGPESKFGMTARMTSVIALLHRLGLSPYGITATPLFVGPSTSEGDGPEVKESIERVERTSPRDALIPKLLYAAGGVLLASFLLCSSLAAWSVWQEAKQQDFLLTQKDKLASCDALPAPLKVIKREKVAQLLERLKKTLSTGLTRGLESLDPGSQAGETSTITLHSFTIKDGTAKMVLRSHDKEILDKPEFWTSQNDRQHSTPKQVPGCHPSLWQISFTTKA